MSSLKSKIVAVAAANKHTAVVSECGEVFTWGCNKEGQLGYGTSNSGSNYTPRLVEYLKGKVFIGVAAAKYHTVVLGVDGEVRLRRFQLCSTSCCLNVGIDLPLLAGVHLGSPTCYTKTCSSFAKYKKKWERSIEVSPPGAASCGRYCCRNSTQCCSDK